MNKKKLVGFSGAAVVFILVLLAIFIVIKRFKKNTDPDTKNHSNDKCDLTWFLAKTQNVDNIVEFCVFLNDFLVNLKATTKPENLMRGELEKFFDG